MGPKLRKEWEKKLSTTQHAENGSILNEGGHILLGFIPGKIIYEQPG
jgi:hypothetical protein